MTHTLHMPAVHLQHPVTLEYLLDRLLFAFVWVVCLSLGPLCYWWLLS